VDVKPSKTQAAVLNMTASETAAVFQQMQNFMTAQQQQLQFQLMQQQMAHNAQQQLLQQYMLHQNIGPHFVGNPCAGANLTAAPFPVYNSEQSLFDRSPAFANQPDFVATPPAPHFPPTSVNVQGRMLGLAGFGSMPTSLYSAGVQPSFGASMMGHGVGGVWPGMGSAPR
jgi:hypothetical protein